MKRLPSLAIQQHPHIPDLDHSTFILFIIRCVCVRAWTGAWADSEATDQSSIRWCD